MLGDLRGFPCRRLVLISQRVSFPEHTVVKTLDAIVVLGCANHDSRDARFARALELRDEGLAGALIISGRRSSVALGDRAAAVMRSPRCPIVLAERVAGGAVAPSVALADMVEDVLDE
jgi:hypothetical protein